MKYIEINGQHELSGSIRVGGAKNSAVALIPAALLSDTKTTINNIPSISDIDYLEGILEYLGARIEEKGNLLTIDSSTIKNKPIPEELSVKLRGSYYFMGVLLAKYKKVEMYFPGGCVIGKRPIDIHLDGFKKLGATVVFKNHKYLIEAKQLKGCKIDLILPSVGATINLMIAATKAVGVTTIVNAAREPEIVNVADFLNSMGANIIGAGTSMIKIKGVKKLQGGNISVMPDRIEAGTYIIAGCLVGNKLKIENLIPDHIEALTLKLKEMDADIEIFPTHVIASKKERLNPAFVITAGYPAFPTDLQQPLTALLTQAKGKSTIEETIYENRFKNLPYLNQMGAKITQKATKIEIYGKTNLKGQDIEATDLRAGACLILAALIAQGNTKISHIEHILRGYENIIEKLSSVGADIKIIDK